MGLRDIGFRKLILVVVRKTYEKRESYLGDCRKWSRQKAQRHIEGRDHAGHGSGSRVDELGNRMDCWEAREERTCQGRYRGS